MCVLLIFLIAGNREQDAGCDFGTIKNFVFD